MAVSFLMVLIILQPRLIAEILLPAEISRLDPLETDRPVLGWQLHNTPIGVIGPPALGIPGAAARDIRPGLGRVVQDSQHPLRTRRLPPQFMRSGPPQRAGRQR